VCDNGFAHGATWKFKEQDGILVDLLINPTMHHFGEDGARVKSLCSLICYCKS